MSEFEHLANFGQMKEAIIKRIKQEFEKEGTLCPMVYFYGIKDGLPVVAEGYVAHFPDGGALTEAMRDMAKKLTEYGIELLYYITTLESWITIPKPGDPMPGEDGFVMPSDNPQKQSCILVTIEGADFIRGELYDIVDKELVMNEQFSGDGMQIIAGNGHVLYKDKG